MVYVERGGPLHFDGKGYHKWAARMMIFLRGKLLNFIVLDKTYAIPAEINTLMVPPMPVLRPSMRQMQKSLITWSKVCVILSLSVFAI
jgi:hypothetical protein